jgi:4,5-DOPA dioxygenase extradiol
MSERQPTIFFGHGNPMNAIEHNAYTQAWSAMGSGLRKPKAVLSISAHWYVPGTFVTADQRPRTIHDFGGFPKQLFEFSYPAPGDPALATRVQSLLAPLTVGADEPWGLDHGTWSVLCHVFPQADVPIVQLSIDERQPPQFHYDLGKRLAPLREEGVLIIGSGNVVHNLETYAWGRHPTEPFDWALRFEAKARELLRAGTDGPLVDYESLGRDALLSIPTPDHYLPLLYVIALRQQGEPIAFPVEGVDGGSVSMLSIRIG